MSSFSAQAQLLAQESLDIASAELGRKSPDPGSITGSERLRRHGAVLEAEKLCAKIAGLGIAGWSDVGSALASCVPAWAEDDVDTLRRDVVATRLKKIRAAPTVSYRQVSGLIGVAEPAELDHLIGVLESLTPFGPLARVLVLRRQRFDVEADRLLFDLHGESPKRLEIPLRASAVYRFAHTWPEAEALLPRMSIRARFAVAWSAGRFDEAFTFLRQALDGASVTDELLFDALDRGRYVAPDEADRIVATASFRSVVLRASAVRATDPTGSPGAARNLIVQTQGRIRTANELSAVLKTLTQWTSAAHRAGSSETPMTLIEGADLLQRGAPTGSLILSGHEDVAPWTQVIDAGRRSGRPVVPIMKGVAVRGLDRELAGVDAAIRPMPYVTAGLDNAVVSREIIEQLRSGHSVAWAIDSLRTVGVKTTVPWLNQPYRLPILPAMIAIGAEAPVIVESVSRTDKGELALRRGEVPTPPDIGDVRIRSIWLTQRVARHLRLFLGRKDAARRPTMTLQYGGTVASRTDLIGLDEWAAKAKDSLFGWIASDERPASDTPLMLDDTEHITDAQLRTTSLRFAAWGLHAQRSRHDHASRDARFGDRHRVLVVGRPGAFLAAATLGLGAAGSIVGFATDDVTDQQLADRIEVFEPDLVIAPARRWARSVEPITTPHVQFYDEDDGFSAVDDLLHGFEPAMRLPVPRPSQPTFAVFTSGSTGLPKLVVAPFGTMTSGAIDTFADLGQGDVLVDHARWDSVSFLDTLASLRAGVPAVVPRFLSDQSPSAAVDRLRNFDITVMTATPTLTDALLDSASWKASPLQGLRAILLWGEPTTPAFLDRVRQAVPGVTLLVQYGTTESPYVAIGDAPVAERIAGSPGGRLCPGVEISEPDPETGLRVVTNPSAMLGYFGDLRVANPRLDELEEVELEIQDELEIDESGYVMIVGRRTDVAKVGGVRVGTAEVQAIAERSPLVRRAVVVPLANESGRSRLGLVLQSDDPSAFDWDHIERDLRDRLGPAATPTERAVVRELPILPSGKVDRGALETLLVAPVQATETAPGSDGETIRDLASHDGELHELLSAYRQLSVARHHPVHRDGLLPPLDSLLSLELLLAAEACFDRPLSLDPQLFASAKTWGELAEAIMDVIHSA